MPERIAPTHDGIARTHARPFATPATRDALEPLARKDWSRCEAALGATVPDRTAP